MREIIGFVLFLAIVRALVTCLALLMVMEGISKWMMRGWRAYDMLLLAAIACAAAANYFAWFKL